MAVSILHMPLIPFVLCIRLICTSVLNAVSIILNSSSMERFFLSRCGCCKWKGSSFSAACFSVTKLAACCNTTLSFMASPCIVTQKPPFLKHL